MFICPALCVAILEARFISPMEDTSMARARQNLAGGCALVIMMMLGGCTVTKQQVYVQDAQVTAPVSLLPVHLVQDIKPGTLTVTPSFSFGARKSMYARVNSHTPVNGAGGYTVDTLHNAGGTISFVPGNNPNQFSGSNLLWNTATVTGGIALDYSVSKSFALTGGLTYASGDGLDSWGGFAGIGLMSEGRLFGMRVDGALQWIPAYYDVHTAIVTEIDHSFPQSSETYVNFYRDAGQSIQFGWYLGLTVNARSPEWPVHPFANIAVSKQKLFSFDPAQVDPMSASHLPGAVTNGTGEAEAPMTLVIITPGISVPVGPTQRVLFGVRFAFAPNGLSREGEQYHPMGSPVVMPVVQFDFEI